MEKRYTAILSFLQKCRTMRELRQLHGLMITTSISRDVIPMSKLIDFVVNSKPEDLNYARIIFGSIDRPSVYIWNSMIKGYSNSDENPGKALVMFREMLQKGYFPDHFTFPFVLKACLGITDGKCVHSCIVKTGFGLNVYVSTCLLNMYVSCGDMVSGLRVFDEIPKWSVVAWTSLIAGFVNNNRFSEAISVFKDMEQCDNVEPNEITMVNVLVACARSRDIETGKWVYSRVRELGMDPFCVSSVGFNLILGNAIMSMFAKCGSLKVARDLFEKMPHRNLVAWNSIISAYYQYGYTEEALSLFFDMKISGIEPDKASFLSVIGVSASTGALEFGRSLHCYVTKTSISKEIEIETALIDMYAKAGDAKSAKRIFDDLQNKDVTAWTSMIIGLAIHGHGKEALTTFQKMLEEANVVPDRITYIGVLSACSHVGLLEEGWKHFNEMKNIYDIEPTIEHYGCMVDLLSRAGCFDEVEKLVEGMPDKANGMICSALLNGCEIHGNIGLAERVRSRVTELEGLGSGVYVMLSNIYATVGRWNEVKLARELMEDRRILKTFAHSSLR